MKISIRIGKCIWLPGLLLLLGCARPVLTAEAPSLTTAMPAASPVPSASAAALPPVEVMVTAVPTPTPSPSPTPSPTPMPTPTPEPTPTPAPFVLTALPADRKPARYLTAGQTEGLFYWAARDMFLAYGQVGEDAPGFYPADETGHVAPGSARVDDPKLVPLYTPADPPEQEDQKLLVLYLPTQSVVAFHEEYGEWVQDRVMICSSGRSGNPTPVGKYTIYERYEYKLLGSEEEDTLCFGFWACRFYKGHLFHSVPISYDAGYDKAKGHTLTNMRSFQKLGTAASHGCVRLTVADAKYIYDLSAFGTVQVWVTKDKGPTAQKPPKINWSAPYTNKQGYGWDPTDPDPANPYLALSPSPIPQG